MARWPTLGDSRRVPRQPPRRASSSGARKAPGRARGRTAWRMGSACDCDGCLGARAARRARRRGSRRDCRRRRARARSMVDGARWITRGSVVARRTRACHRPGVVGRHGRSRLAQAPGLLDARRSRAGSRRCRPTEDAVRGDRTGIRVAGGRRPRARRRAQAARDRSGRAGTLLFPRSKARSERRSS